ncbi:MAG: GNAT family N-acetyltransferase [Candidatus Puniceispirillales bacterium]
MSLTFTDIKKTPIEEINVLENEGFENFENSFKIKKRFISKMEGLSIKQRFYIGHIYANKAADQADIVSFIIKDKYRREGFGTILFGKFISTLKSKGVKEFFLEVSEKNVGAQKFYNRFGFIKIASRKNYYKTILGIQNAYLLKLQT